MEQQPKTAQIKKSKWLIPAIIVVGIIFLGLGTWVGYNQWVKSKNTQQPAQEQPKDEFAGWQTYRNEEYGFEFKLPPKWKDAVIEQTHDEFYNGEVFLLKLEGGNICDISMYLSEAWKKYQEAETAGKPIYLISKGDLIFGWGCGQDDYGYKGFEDFNKAIDDGNFDAINSGKILGPFAEFKSLILPTFKFFEQNVKTETKQYRLESTVNLGDREGESNIIEFDPISEKSSTFMEKILEKLDPIGAFPVVHLLGVINGEKIIIDHGAGDACWRSEALYEIDIKTKKIIKLDDTDYSCHQDPNENEAEILKEQEDNEKFTELKRKLVDQISVLSFCGQSTKGSCSIDTDCAIGGCSSQVCQSKSEEPIATTCEYRECYNPQPYDLTCGCKNNQCQWK